MNDERPSVSRRGFLRGAAAVSVASLLLSGPAVAQGAKQPKSAVNYQDSPNKGQQCSHCRWFQKPDSCQLVQGKISPSGWCKMFMPG